MARPLRLSFENAAYHIMARGNRKDAIFLSNRDKDVFVDKMNETFSKYSIICYAYCLVNNHYHLFVKTPFANISEGMHNLNASYANWFKAKHDIVGVIFQGRYKSIIVEEDSYALALNVYIHTNAPVTDMRKDLEKYRWSSYPDYIGIRKPFVENLDTSLILSKFGDDPDKAMSAYKKFLIDNAGMESPLREVRKGYVLGSDDFVERIQQKIANYGEKREIPETRSAGLLSADAVIEALVRSLPTTRQEIFEKRRGSTINHLALYLMRKKTDLSLNAVGGLFGMDYAAVSIAVKRFKERLKKDGNARGMLERALKALEKC